jgi:hypothetical protein
MSMVKIPGEERLFYDTATKTVYERQENGDFNPVSVSGAGLVTPDRPGQARICERDAVDATVVEFDLSNYPVSEVFAKALNEAATTPELNSIALCFGAPNVATATAFLTAGNRLLGEGQRLVITPKDGIVKFGFTSPIDKIHSKRDLGSDAMRLICACTEV